MADHDNNAIVADFCAAWTRNDVEAIIAAFTDDAVYHNIPMQAIAGRDNIAAMIRPFLASASIAFDTLRQVANGDVVMNERIDTITSGDKTTALPVMGVFELHDGKIAAWRDYFDLKMFTGSDS